MNWATLKSLCLDEVARELVRGKVRGDTVEARSKHWQELIVAHRDEAAERVRSMDGLELLGLLTDVLTRQMPDAS